MTIYDFVLFIMCIYAAVAVLFIIVEVCKEGD